MHNKPGQRVRNVYQLQITRKNRLIATYDFEAFSTNLLHILGKRDWRVEVYTQKCLKFFSKTTIKSALFLSLLVTRFLIKKYFVKNKKTACTFYMKLAASNMNKQKSLIR